jgi:hypothetical protein
MTEDTCGRCRWWHAMEGEFDGLVLGSCRRRSPSLAMPGERAGWPRTATVDWCGEFQSPPPQAQPHDQVRD